MSSLSAKKYFQAAGLFVFVFISSFAILPPREAHAIGGSIVSCFASSIGGGLGSIGSGLVPVSPEPLNKKECLDGVAREAAQAILDQIVQTTLDWAKGGFGGDPAFLHDAEQYLRDIASEEGAGFISEYGLSVIDASINSPFNTRGTSFTQTVQSKLLESERSTQDESLRCTLCDEYDEHAFFDDFTGGWGAWIKATAEPQNNPFGNYIVASGLKEERKSEATEEVKEEVTSSGGYLNLKTCAPGAHVEIPETGDGSLFSGFRYCVRYITETPGRVIADAVGQTIASDIRKAELADEINEIVGALFDSTLSKISTGGLRGAGAGGRRNSRDETGAFRLIAIDPGSDNQDVLDLLIPGRVARSETEHLLPSEIPEGVGQGLSGGRIQLDPTLAAAAASPAITDINLSDPKYFDWVYFGLRTGFGTEPQRKNRVAPQIAPGVFGVSDPGTSFVAPPVGWEFGWSGGYPQEESADPDVGTDFQTQGLGITEPGQRFSFTVRGGDRDRKLTLYLAAIEATGELRVSFDNEGEIHTIPVGTGVEQTTTAVVEIDYNTTADESLFIEYRAKDIGGTEEAPGMVALYGATLEENNPSKLYPPSLAGRPLTQRAGTATTFEEAFGEHWWPITTNDAENPRFLLGPGQYISLAFRTEKTYTGKGKMRIKELTPQGTTTSQISFSKYPGDFVSMKETGFQGDRYCLAGLHGFQVPFGLSADTIFWHNTIPAREGSRLVTESCQLKPNTRYYFNFACSPSSAGACEIEVDLEDVQ